MDRCKQQLVLLFLVSTVLYSYAQTVKPKLTLDEFLDYVNYQSLDFSPTGQHLLIRTFRSSWDTDSYENSLWIYDVRKEDTRLVTNSLHDGLPAVWSPSGAWVAFFLNNDSLVTGPSNSSDTVQHYMYLYSSLTRQVYSIPMGSVQPSVVVWADDDKTIYFTSMTQRSKEEEKSYTREWRHVINYRDGEPGSTIHRLDISLQGSSPSGTITAITHVPFIIAELLYVPFQRQLVISSRSKLFEDVEKFELHSIHLNNVSASLSRLTYMEGAEQSLQLSGDGKHILFRMYPISSGKIQVPQRRIYSFSLTSGHIERLGKNFGGAIEEFQAKSDGGVFIVGQLGLDVQVYTQESATSKVIRRSEWNGTYDHFTAPSGDTSGLVAFTYSSFDRPKEVYVAKSIDRLASAKAITNHNALFTRRSLPQSKAYRWINSDDGQEIEGVLHYPPDQYGSKNLSLLVWIHGGPFAASLNEMQLDWYKWALMAATEGWLVLEPNYRGSTGYGDKFLNDIISQLVSLPGQDILMGVDQLVHEGIADPKRLAVGGYSFGGFLTNWLITQTTRFNAALSGAGDIEHVSGWGTMDLPVLIKYLHGGFPWEVPEVYQYESPIYHLHKVRTPTLITTGEVDVRVNADQSYILERALRYLGVPTQLVVFRNEGHDLERSPWSGKIKIREEIKWLRKYGNQSWISVYPYPPTSMP